MAFIFSNTVRDVVRDRNLSRSIQDKTQHLAIHGITFNGTYFFCNLVYQKNLPERKNISIFKLIEAYANTEEHAERVKLKAQIKEACGDQVEGIALLFSNAGGTYGFVTGKRVKVARWRDIGPLELDADELFSDPERQLNLSFKYRVFILEKEEEYVPELINQYIQDNEKGGCINTDVINAINYIGTSEKPLEDMSRYLHTAYVEIKDSVLRQQVKKVYDALQLLDDDREIKYKVTVLTLQLLSSQDAEKRKQLLADYTKLASSLYGSKIPTKMIVGISLFLLGVSFLTFSILTAHDIPLCLIIINTGVLIIGGLICGIDGKNEFFNDEAKQKRNTAKTFFNLKENLNNISDDLIPQNIRDPSVNRWL